MPKNKKNKNTHIKQIRVTLDAHAKALEVITAEERIGGGANVSLTTYTSRLILEDYKRRQRALQMEASHVN